MVLLSLYDGSRWQADLEDLQYLSDDNAERVLMLMHFLLSVRRGLSYFIPPMMIAPVIEQWGTATEEGSDAEHHY
jgi:hypothetical protein